MDVVKDERKRLLRGEAGDPLPYHVERLVLETLSQEIRDLCRHFWFQGQTHHRSEVSIGHLRLITKQAFERGAKLDADLDLRISRCHLQPFTQEIEEGEVWDGTCVGQTAPLQPADRSMLSLHVGDQPGFANTCLTDDRDDLPATLGDGLDAALQQGKLAIPAHKRRCEAADPPRFRG